MIAMAMAQEVQQLIDAAKAGDAAALAELMEAAVPIARAAAISAARKHVAIDADDLEQDLLLAIVPKAIERYDPKFGKPFRQYLYHRIRTGVVDVLRKNDPLGIGNPQRKHYPTWSSVIDHEGELISRDQIGDTDVAELLGIVADRVRLADPTSCGGISSMV